MTGQYDGKVDLSGSKERSQKSRGRPRKSRGLSTPTSGPRQAPGTRETPRRSRGLGSRLRHPIFRFVVVLLILLGLFELILATSFVKEKLIPPYLEFYARLSGGVMEVFGEKVTVDGATVSSPRYNVDIKRGCDAMQPSILFIAAVLAAPVIRWPKVPGLIFGLLFLMVMNLVRVVSLFYVGVHYPSAFDVMHHDVWQAAFIFLAILAWTVWALWAAGKTISVAHDTT